MECVRRKLEKLISALVLLFFCGSVFATDSMVSAADSIVKFPDFTLGATGNLDPSQPYTAQVWFKHTAGSSGDYYAFAAGVTSSMGMGVVFGDQRPWPTINGGSGSPSSVLTCGYTQDAQAWVHKVVVWTGSQYDIYINGTKCGTHEKTDVINTSSSGLFLGGQSTSTGSELDGEIDDFAIWSRALSDTEVAALYNGGSGLPADSDSGNYGGSGSLIALFTFEGNSICPVVGDFGTAQIIGTQPTFSSNAFANTTTQTTQTSANCSSPQPQATLTVSATPTSINVGNTSALSTSGGSGTGAVTYSVASGPCTVSGSTLTGTGAGTCSITATKAADSTYTSATSAAIDVTVNAVLTLPEPGGSNVTIPAGNGSLISYSKITDPTPPSGVLVGDQIGTYSFTATGVSGSLTITIDVGAPIAAGTKIYKVNGSTWTEITTATFGETTVTYTVTDNDPVLDLDPTAGRIQDPVALISPVLSSGSVTPVPVLPLGALLLLGGLAGLLGMRQLRKAD